MPETAAPEKNGNCGRIVKNNMDKQEFLDKMRLYLNGKVSADTVTETVRYYEEYINNQVRLGNSMQEVMEALGDPRLIARTIVETSGRQNGGRQESDRREYKDENSNLPDWREKALQLVARTPGWVWTLLVLVIVFLILGLVFKVLIALAPVLLVVGVVIYVLRFLKGGDNR